ncbi:Polyribonucleotide nucleotidyltransferase 2, mitochondrial [Dionaea muscipula]
MSIGTKANTFLSTLPLHLTSSSSRLNLRGICSGGLSLLSDHELPAETPTSYGAKVLETFREEFEVGNKVISFETGKIARFANGAVVMAMDETKVLSTVASSKADSPRDFLPLTVDYQEKQYAQGVIPNTFMRREGAPKERELLCGRLIDRPIRPLFAAGFYHEVQVMASVLSSDGKQDPDVMAVNATSAALMLSDIPWAGPIGVVRVGRICGQFVINPTMDELSLSDLNLVYACTRDKTLMIDVQAREISEKDLEVGLRLAHPEAVKYLKPQIQLAAKAGKQKKEYKLSMMSEHTMEKVRSLAESPIEAVFTDPSYGKFERGEALDRITQDLRRALEDDCDEESLKLLSKAVDTVRKQVVRRRIIKEGLRVDGRQLDEVRPIYCEAGNLPALHGSSLFSRGETQVLCTVTLGAPADAQRLESLVGPASKRFMLHYSFPPFSINEVAKRVGLNRREVGHGTLAEKALVAVLPPDDEFPFTVRVNSEVMASDGSTSMASVCGGSMALMDAGIPLREHVAGVSVGLVSEVDPFTGEIKDYRILTDILGLEDHLGDMDFKIAGTQKGITAIQLDIKPAGIPLDIICQCLEPALKGRLKILDSMEREIKAARTQDNRNSPRLVTLKYNNESIRRFIGPLGALKRKTEEETGARISVDDGTLTIVAKNQYVLDKVLDKIDSIIGREIEIGGVYKGVVSSIKEFGAFVEFNGGQLGLLHISELSHKPVSRVSDVVFVGQKLSLMCIGQDVRGNIKLSLKATLPSPGKEANDLVNCSASRGVTADIGTTVDIASNAQAQESLNLVEQPVQEYQVKDEESSASATPSFLIRSAAECDVEEKTSGLFPDPVNISAVKLNRKSKSLRLKTEEKEVEAVKSAVTAMMKDLGEQPVQECQVKDEESSASATPSFLIRSAAECDVEEKTSGFYQDPVNISGVKLSRKSKSLNLKTEKKAVTAKNIKLGTKLPAKVFEIRARGLVLDLDGGIKGMLRFEGDGKRDFEIGDELRVVCTSFSSKGVPVMSLVKD